ncbi:MAG: hypothetical protein D6820_04675, partial [Lentisphaerae bacterium]
SPYCGGFCHLTLLGARLVHQGPGQAPAIDIRRGHVYLRDIQTSGYSRSLLDHGRPLNAEQISEYISVHGRRPSERLNVALTIGNAPKRSLGLPVKPTPEIPQHIWDSLDRYTIVDHTKLKNGRLTISVPTPWVIVDPSGNPDTADDAPLLQAALDCGAPYVGLLNTGAFLLRKPVVINGRGKRNVQLVYGLMTDLIAGDEIIDMDVQPDIARRLVFRIETGKVPILFIKGIRCHSSNPRGKEYQFFLNNAAHTVVFEDIRCKRNTRGYRNGPTARGQDVFFENVEFACNHPRNDELMVFDHQQVWARQFNLEQVINNPQRNGTVAANLVSHGGTLWVFGQKMGEFHGVFLKVTGGSRTEMLSVFFNQGRQDHGVPGATNF